MPYLITTTGIQSVPGDYSPMSGEFIAQDDQDPVFLTALEALQVSGTQEQVKREAQVILEANDKMALRLWKAGRAWPTTWQAYDESLREVVRGNASVLPAAPASKPWEV
jgi:hypothetical protein